MNIELYNALHYHMVNKRLLTKDLKNGLTVSSMYNDLGLRVNHYSNGVSAINQCHCGISARALKNNFNSICTIQVVTVNCARIIYGNQVATNGVVHVIDRVISAVGNTIQDVIEVNDDLTTLSVSTDYKEEK